MNLNIPLVTVVIPAYNAEKYIKDTLDSIFLQETSFTFSVHVFDDCSNDSTVQICQEFQEKHDNFYLTIHPKNIGMSKNQHFAISNAQTKYVAYLDSDDLYCSTNFKFISFIIILLPFKTSTSYLITVLLNSFKF